MNLLERIKKCNNYVMCSTLNQVVNYMPYIYLCTEAKEKIRYFNITYQIQEDKTGESYIRDRFPNDKWDKNYQNVLSQHFHNSLPEHIEIKLDREKYGKYKAIISENIIGRMDANEPNFILWNLTGGQRSVVFNIQKCIEDDFRKKRDGQEHTIIYIEGNTQKVIAGYYDENGWHYEEVGLEYEKNDLTLEEVFNLAGFKVKEGMNSLEFGSNSTDKNQEKFKKLLDEYYYFFDKMYKDNEEFRTALIESKRFKASKEKGDRVKAILDTIAHYKEEGKSFSAEFTNSINNDAYPLGYMLEYMVTAIIYNIIQEDEEYKKIFKSISHNVKVDNMEEISNNSEQFCELDVVLMTKTGQIIVFECKSGSMESDVGKSREYTAYVLGGVYGKPVFVSLLLHNEVMYKELLELDMKETCKETKGEINLLDNYKNMKDAINSAMRVGMDICCMDTMKSDLKRTFQFLL